MKKEGDQKQIRHHISDPVLSNYVFILFLIYFPAYFYLFNINLPTLATQKKKK